MISNKTYIDTNRVFIFENIGDTIKKYIEYFPFEVINSNGLKEAIKDKIIELVSGMVSNFKNEDFRFDIDLNYNYDVITDKYLLNINFTNLHPYTDMILKRKNFHILSRRLKIKEILS